MTINSLLRAPNLLSVAFFTVAAGLGVVLPTVTTAFPSRDIMLLLVAAVGMWIAWVRPSLSIVLVVGTFVFSAGVRRLLPAVNPALDLTAILPFVVALPLAARGVGGTKPVCAVLLLAWITVRALFSFDAVLVGVAGWLTLAVPLLAAFGIARVPSGLATFVRATVVCGSVAAIYGILQYFLAFPWDVEWLMRANLDSAGQPGTTDFRPFSTLPAPGPAAVLSAVVILIMVFRKELVWRSLLLRAVALASSSTFLLLTQVRSVWLALIVSLLFGSLAGGRPARQILPVAAIVVAVVLVLPPGEVVVARFDTLSDLQEDVSYRSRIEDLTKTGSLISPLGLGVGKLSSATRVEGGTSVDNGYLVILGELGIVGAVLMTWVLAWLVQQRWRPEDGAFLLMLLVSMAAGAAFSGFTGLLLWTLSGVARPQEEETLGEHQEHTPDRSALVRTGSPTGS